MNTSNHRFILQPYQGLKSRHRCPSCNKLGKFSLYMDTRTGNPIHETVGRCDREIKCAYHLTPKQYFENTRHCEAPRSNLVFGTSGKGKRQDCFVAKPSRNDGAGWRKGARPAQKRPPVLDIDGISPRVLNQSIIGLPHNHFFTYLQNQFGFETAIKLARRYYIGNSSHWPGATIFWQVDMGQHIRTGKIMLYNPDTGKRVKEPFVHITWVHKALNLTQYTLTQCLFGLHLVNSKTKTIAIVESEKTAIICSACLPQYTWLACGSLSNLTEERLLPLKGRKIILYPDLNAYDKWKLKAAQLSHLAAFTVSDILENIATAEDRKQGLDLADYLGREMVGVNL